MNNELFLNEIKNNEELQKKSRNINLNEIIKINNQMKKKQCDDRFIDKSLIEFRKKILDS